jgi:hypothetical protein
LEKVVVLVILSIEKLGLLFLSFSTILNRFKNFSQNLVKGEESFYALDPITFKSLTDMPLAPPLGPDGDGELVGGEVGHGQANKRWGTVLRLTRD